MAKNSTMDNLRAWPAKMVRTVRTGTFGAERPRRHFARYLRRAAEAIEPRQADLRVIVPEEGPHEVETELPSDGANHRRDMD